MERKRYAREFKLEAVRLVKERGVSVAQASRDLGVHANVLREWVRAFAADPEQAFPGRGQMKSDQLEVERLRREVQKLKAERDILKNHLGQRPPVGVETAEVYPRDGRERPAAFWWKLPRKKTWSMGCCARESGDAVR